MNNKYGIKVFHIIILILVVSVVLNFNGAKLKAENNEITIDQGVAKIKHITKNNLEEIKYITTRNMDSKILYMYESNEKLYNVDGNTGNIVGVVNKKASIVEHGIVTPDKVREIAEKLINQYRDDISVQEMRLVRNDKFNVGTFDEYIIIWKKYNNKGIDTGNSVAVILNGDGELACLACHESSSMALEQEVKINVEDAKKIAYNALREKLIKLNRISVLKVQENYNTLTEQMVYRDKLVWKVDINGVQNLAFEDLTTDYCIYINCTTGEIVDIVQTV